MYNYKYKIKRRAVVIMTNTSAPAWKKATTPEEKLAENIHAIIVLIIFVVCFCVVGHIESHYTKRATVTDVINDYVTVEDEQGQVWAFGGDGFYKGDRVKLTMFTNYTDYIYDDEIVKAKIIH